jgi:hypothetical protein
VALSQQDAERLVTWYASALGLTDWRIEVRADANANPEHDTCGDAWISAHYPTVIIGLKPKLDKEGAWKHDDQEETIAHELVHVTLEPLGRLFEEVVGLVPKKQRKGVENVVARIYERHLEHAIERISWAMVALRHSDPDAPPEPVGRLMPRSDKEQT